MYKKIRLLFDNRDYRISVGFFLVLGLFVLTAAPYSEHKQITEIGIGIGSIILSIPIIDVIWRMLGGDPTSKHIEKIDISINSFLSRVSIASDCQTLGISKLVDRSGNFGSQKDWLRLVDGAHHRIDLLGRTMFAWIDGTNLDRIIHRKITEGVQIRWLIMSMDNVFLGLIEENDTVISNILTEKLKRVNKFVSTILNELPPEKRRLFQVRTFRNLPLYCNLARFDDVSYVTPYLFYNSSNNSPLFVISGKESPWLSAYENEFEQIWRKSEEFRTN